MINANSTSKELVSYQLRVVYIVTLKIVKSRISKFTYKISKDLIFS